MSKYDCRDETIVRLFKDGFTYMEIAALNDLSISRVRKIIRAAGVGDKEGGLYVREAPPVADRPIVCYGKEGWLKPPSLFRRIINFFKGV